jgi:hypothetical protein
MKKTLVILLFVSTVMAMSMPGMADPRININKTVDLAQGSINTAAGTINQALNNTGSQSNSATVLALGGKADAFSQGDASGMANNSGNAKVMTGNGSANAGNIGSGNGLANSEGTAIGGDGTNGDVNQANGVTQTALAEIDTVQSTVQGISETEILIPTVNVNCSVFDNTLGSDNMVTLG